MAKVFGPHQSPRAPSLRGAFYIRPGRGGMVAAAWPKPHKKKLSPRQKEAVEKFKEAAILAKYAPAEDQMRSRQLAEGSQFLPRDLQYMAIYGRLATLFFTNGQRRYQLASRYELTELLDILGFAPGTILFRGPEFWEGLPPGGQGQVIQMLDGKPAWAEPSGGGSGNAAPISVVSRDIAEENSAYGTKAVVVIPRQNFNLGGVGVFVERPNIGSIPFHATIARLSAIEPAPVIDEILAVSQSSSTGSEAYDNYDLPLTAPVQLLAGIPYLIAVSRESGTGTTNLPLLYPNTPRYSVWCGAPANYHRGSFFYDTLTLDTASEPASTGSLLCLIWPVQAAE